MSKHISLPRSRMWRTRAATALAAAGALVMSGGLVMLAAPAATATVNAKVWICKYSHTPEIGEKAQTVNSVDYNENRQVGSWGFEDAQGFTYVYGFSVNEDASQVVEKPEAAGDCPPYNPPGDVEVVPNVEVNDPCGTEDDSYEVTNDTVEVDGDTITKFTTAESNKTESGVHLSFTAGAGFFISEANQTFDVVWTDEPCEPDRVGIPAPPEVSAPDCDSDGYFTVTPHEGMTTFLDGVKVTQPTLVDKAGDYTIGYIANPGTVFESTGKTRATQDLTVLPATGDCPPGQIDIPAPPTVSAPDCDSAGSFTVTPHNGMTTFLDGVKVTAPTVVSLAGKYTIGYVAGPETVFKGTGKTRATQEVIALAATGNCPTTQTRSVPPAPVPTAPACEVDGSLTLPAPADGLTWAIQQISGTTDGSSPYGPGVYRVTVTSSGLPFSTGGQTYTYPDITVAPNTGPCVLGVQEIAPTVSFTDPTCENLDRAKWSGNLTDLVDYTVSGTPGRGNSITVTANIKPAVADEFAFPDGFDNTFDHSYPSKADLNCPTVKGSESSRPTPHKTPTVLGTQAVAPTAVDAGLASLPSSSATSTTSLLAQLMVAGGLLLLLAGGWLGLGRREDGAHQA